MTTVHISRLKAGANPRSHFDEAEHQELVNSIRANGVIQPILVRPVAGADIYEIIAGERRYRAAVAAFDGDYEMPVAIRNASDGEAEELALIENVQRAGMSPIDEASGAERIVLRNSGDKAETARVLGWSLEKLERRLALLRCASPVRQALTERKIQLGHAELLATLTTKQQLKVVEQIVEHGITVAELKQQLGKYANKLADAIFDITSCTNCIHNSARQVGLFGEHLSDGYCTDPEHFSELTDAELERRAKALREDFRTVQIVRGGDRFVPIPLLEEGRLGVGKQQASACRSSCASFGCALSAVEGSLGEVTKGLCFDSACNQAKVASRIKAERGVAAQVQSNNPIQKALKKQEVSDEPTVKASQRLTDYRLNEWRRMAAKELLNQPERAQQFLVALAVSGQAGCISASHMSKAVKRIAGKEISCARRLPEALSEVREVHGDALLRSEQAVPASAAFGISASDLDDLLSFLAVDEGKHWKINKEILDLLTKNEIEQVATEIGLKKHLGATFKKLIDGKKDELIDGLLNAQGFDATGLIPSVMRYQRRCAT